MHQADLKHTSPSLQAKLAMLYTLNRDKTIDLGFRPPYANLLKALGNPHKHLPPTIHVAGTNGKGSTIAMLRAIYETQGYKVHTYTSPHLVRFNERIVLAGEEIDNQTLETLIDSALELNDGAQCTFFEITTAIAFTAFANTKADILLLETGLGGRLDCTNVIENPIATIITAIGLDHTEFLGDTLEQIALEKAGIMKKGVPCIIAQQTEQAKQNRVIDALTQHAQRIGSKLCTHGSQWNFTSKNNRVHYVSKEINESFQRPALIGSHQDSNFATAITCIMELQKSLPVQISSLQDASKRVKWPARLQKLNHTFSDESNELWLDGGHNENAGQILGNQLSAWKNQDNKKTHLILAMKGDKDPIGFLSPMLKHVHSITIIPLHGVGSCLTKEKLQNTKLDLPPLHEADNCKEAIQNITNKYKNNLRILTCGSLYLAEQFL